MTAHSEEARTEHHGAGTPLAADEFRIAVRCKACGHWLTDPQSVALGVGPPAAGTTPMDSREVNWWQVHEFINTMVAQANYGPLPAAGTPAWCALADGDPRKLLALATAGEHHVLRMETAQKALAEAQQDVSAAEDWAHIARQVYGDRGPAYIPRRTA